MAGPKTRAKNANQHPGHIVLEGKQKRRTPQQKQADDALAEQQRLEEEAARARGIQRVANIVDRTMQEEQDALTNRPKPRPRPIGASNSAARRMEDEAEMTEDPQPDGDIETDEQVTNLAVRKPRSQRAPTRDAVQAARQSVISEVHQPHADNDQISQPLSEPDQRSDGQIRNDLRATKNEFAGVGRVKNWANQLATTRPLHPLLSQRSQSRTSSRSQHTRSISVTSSSNDPPTKGPRATPASTQPATPTDSQIDIQEATSYLEGNDNVERAAMAEPVGNKEKPRYPQDITEVVSSSEPDDFMPRASPPPTQKTITLKTTAPPKIAQNLNMEPREDTKEPENMPVKKSIKSSKRTQQNQPGDDADTPPDAPPPKRAKRNVPASRAGSGAQKRYINSDLPAGATDNNLWRRVFISTIACFAAGYSDPWIIPDHELTPALQVIWDSVYKNISHTIAAGGSVFYVSKQNLNNWRAGFAAAAITVITTFFASDSDFLDVETRTAFAKTFLKDHRFLFSENEDDNPKLWSGIWRGPFVLQTFAHHFNFIQGHTEITELDVTGPRSALALSCAAVCRALTLFANKNISFKGSDVGETWLPIVEKGGQYEFNEAVWGAMTRRILEPIMQLSDSQLDLVVRDTQPYVKKGKTPATSVESEVADELENLFFFR